MDRLYQDCTMLHVDADGFFAAVEQALTPSLRGRPVVTGAERGIIAAASYEAKACGVKRGMQLHEACRRCPGLAVVPSDYEAYSLYSRHLFAILRRVTPWVEEYSIDEAFADLTGCGRRLGVAPEALAAHIRDTARLELGITVSVGISLTKTLAKRCSKLRKPDGQAVVRREHVARLLACTAVDDIWGIGPAGAAKLTALGIRTAAEFISMQERDVRRLLHKPGCVTWRELRGERVLPLETEPKQQFDSMLKGHTFAPPSRDPALVRAEALRNAVDLLARLRRRRHLACELGLVLRRQDYTAASAAAALPAPTAQDAEITPVLGRLFDALHEPATTYRATLVWCGGLTPAAGRQLDLFADTPQRLRRARVDDAVDAIRQRFGQRSIGPAALLELRRKPPHARDARPDRAARPLQGETARRLAIPRLTPPNPV